MGEWIQVDCYVYRNVSFTILWGTMPYSFLYPQCMFYIVWFNQSILVRAGMSYVLMPIISSVTKESFLSFCNMALGCWHWLPRASWQNAVACKTYIFTSGSSMTQRKGRGTHKALCFMVATSMVPDFLFK